MEKFLNKSPIFYKNTLEISTNELILSNSDDEIINLNEIPNNSLCYLIVFDE